MGYQINNPTKAAEDIRALSRTLNIGGDGMRVEVLTNPTSVKVDFLERGQRGPIHVAGFQLVEQANCCGVLVSTRTYVKETHQKQGLGQAMMPLKEAIAREFGYSALACTVIVTNLAETHILTKCGWTKGFSFVNSRTKNTVAFYHKAL